jgi:signal transduction histidine kinase
LTSGFRILELDKVLPDHESISLPGIVVNTLIIISDRYKQVDFIAFEKVLEKADYLTEHFKLKCHRSKIFSLKGSYYMIIGNDELGLSFYNRAIYLADSLGENSLLSKIYLMSGFYNVINGNYQKAVSDLDNSFNYATETDDLNSKFLSLIYKGNIYLYLEEYGSALEYYKKTLEFIPESKYNSYHCNLKYYLGYCFQKLGNYEKAMEEYNEGLEIAKANKINDIQGLILSRIGDYYLDTRKDVDSAIIFYSQSYRVLTDNIIFNHASTVATKMSNAWSKKGDLQNALAFDFIALNFRKRVNVKFAIASSYTNIGNIFFNMGNSEKAEKYFLLGLLKLNGTNMRAQISYAYKKLYELYNKNGNVNKAFDNYKSHRAYEDTVNINKASVELSRYKMKYDIGRKNADLKEIELQRQNEKLIMLTFTTILISIAVILTYRAYRSKMIINKELENLTANQEKTIQVRTKDLKNEIVIRKEAEAKLNEALVKEKHLSELKGRFVSIVSHEFRTPLTGIETSMEILLKSFISKSFDFNKVKYFDRIKSNLDRITKLMDDVLILGKKESGKLIYSPELIDVISIIQDLQDSNYKTADGHILFNIHIKGEHRKVIIDNNMMYHIINNLISNAVKFSTKGQKPDITVSYLNNGFEIITQDYGIGIPENEIPNLFQSFTRASNASSIAGSGLGLVIIKQLVESHFGKVTLESKLNSGSKFTVFIPQ